MLSDTQRKTIFDTIDTGYTVLGESVIASKRYMNQFANDVFPAVVLNYPIYSNTIFEYLDDRYEVTEETTDSFTFATGTDDYLLTITNADIIREVKAYISGRFQIVPAVNYHIDLATNEIDWDGPVYPDNGTIFTVEYHHQRVRIVFQVNMYDMLSVNVFTEDDTIGATFINGIISSQAIADAVRKKLKYTFAQDDMVITNFSELADLDALAEGEYTRRRQFDCWIRHIEEVTIEVEDIESVTFVIENLLT